MLRLTEDGRRLLSRQVSSSPVLQFDGARRPKTHRSLPLLKHKPITQLVGSSNYCIRIKLKFQRTFKHSNQLSQPLSSNRLAFLLLKFRSCIVESFKHYRTTKISRLLRKSKFSRLSEDLQDVTISVIAKINSL